MALCSRVAVLLLATGIAPYMAIELAAFDLLPQHMSSFARGFSAALIATTFCYPLDTLRWSTPLTSCYLLFLNLCKVAPQQVCICSTAA